VNRIARHVRGALLAIAFVALALTGLALRKPAPRAQATKKPAAPAEAPAGSFDAAVAESKRQRKLAEVMADGAPGSWSRRAAAASAEMGYAQLTGDYEGYYAADRSLTEAFRVARASIDDEAVGPLLLKAQLDYELHRLKPALASLRVPEQQAEFFHDQKLLAEITSLRGAITFALGSYDDGLAMMRRSIQLDPTSGHKQRLAIALTKVGGDAEATRIFDETSDGSKPPRHMAWIELQRAKLALEHGDRAEGRSHLEKANALFPGFWQTEEHLAELDAEEGHTDRAIASYRALVAKTSDPEFMDALSRLLADRDPAEAHRLRDRSNALYDDRLARLPEASYGHALEHFLQMAPAGEDPARAVEIATKNRDLRPNGEARTRLAQAYVKAGRIREAREEIAKVTSSKWISAESYATAAIILRLSGADASTMEAKALAINPHALEELDWLARARS
jgi:tetratricopeptide (TPR) repeat protein